jgi:hypothetical protein
MFRSILYSVGLSYLFRKLGGRGGGGGYGSSYGRSRPFGRRW